MVWGAFGHGGVSELVVLPKGETVNKDVYYTILNEHLEDAFERTNTTIFQQDGAPCHTAKLIKNWFADCGIQWIPDWPGNSPDLSPIENLWAIVKLKIRDRDTSTVAKLEQELRRPWHAIDPEILQSLADSAPRRLAEVVKRKGEVTKY